MAATMAINRTLSKDRVLIGREIRSVYRMNTFDAKNEVPQEMANTRTLTGKLKGNAGFTPFEYFKIKGTAKAGAVTVKRAVKYGMKNGKRVVAGRQTAVGGASGPSIFQVQITKQRTSTFMHTFVINTKNGPMLMNRGRYQSRTTKLGGRSGRFPVTRLRTLSVWQEINNKGIRGKSEALLKKEFTAEYLRLLNVGLTNGKWR